MGVEMENLRSKQRPKRKSVEIAASQFPEDTKGPTRREVDLVDPLLQPEQDILNRPGHIDVLALFRSIRDFPGIRTWYNEEAKRERPLDITTVACSVNNSSQGETLDPNAKEPSPKAEGVIDARSLRHGSGTAVKKAPISLLVMESPPLLVLPPADGDPARFRIVALSSASCYEGFWAGSLSYLNHSPTTISRPSSRRLGYGPRTALGKTSSPAYTACLP